MIKRASADMKHRDLRLLRHLCTFWPVEPARACLVRSCRLRSRAREHASLDLADLDLGDAHTCGSIYGLWNRKRRGGGLGGFIQSQSSEEEEQRSQTGCAFCFEFHYHHEDYRATTGAKSHQGAHHRLGLVSHLGSVA